MNSHWTYLMVNLGAVLVPLLFSFHPKLQFYKQWKSALSAIFIVAILFIGWDIYYTSIGVWGFNPSYLIGIKVVNLPIEEVLFFICIPYACLFTYHCFKLLLKFKKIAIFDTLIKLLTAVLLILAALNIERAYTSVTFVLFSLVLVYFVYIKQPDWLPRMFTSLLILIVPFLVVNGILTGTGIPEQVVWYNPAEFMGYRIGTIPVEDFFYGSFLITLNVLVYERIRIKS